MLFLSTNDASHEEISSKTYRTVEQSTSSTLMYLQGHGRYGLPGLPDGALDAGHQELQPLRLLLLPQVVL